MGVIALGALRGVTVARAPEPGRARTNLVFVASPEKKTFTSGEDVVFAFRLENHGDKDVLVSRTFLLDRHVLMRIVGPDGGEVPWCGRIDGSELSSKDFAVLRPGASISAKKRVSCGPNKAFGYKLEKPGAYVATATYHLTEPIDVLEQMAGNALVAKPRLVAPKVRFWIK
jgi:hypothetical protein